MAKPQNKKKITLALQGGAVYGAFTWGVLDRILQDDRIEVTGISGASAGALNAVAVADGMDKNGSKGAIESLNSMWESLTYDQAVRSMPIIGKASSEASRKLSGLFKALSKRDDKGILKDIQATGQGVMMSLLSKSGGLFEDNIAETIDFEALRANKSGIPVFVSATDVNAHKARIFDRSDVSALSIKASCAIPIIIGDVEIDGSIYWDGGFTENPPIAPLRECDASDILIIQTIPFLERESDMSVDSVADRLLEFRSNSSIRKDLEYIQQDNARVSKNPKAAAELGIKEIHTHLIGIDREVKNSHMMRFDRAHMKELHDLGFTAADKWLKNNFDSIGLKSTFTPNDNETSSTPKKIKTRNKKL